LKFSSGDAYEGGFVNDLFHGKGIYKSANGDLFKGQWKNGMKNGKGTF
jgi:radial spoke head protein 1